MTSPLDAVRRRAEETYNAASDHFDDVPLAFWSRYGRRTIERLRLRPGARVLDRVATDVIYAVARRP
jgi:hypothetical protein